MTQIESPLDLNFVPQKQFVADISIGPSINVVVLSGSNTANHGIREMAERNHWSIHPCSTLREMMFAIDRLRGPVVLCESRIGNTSWRDVLKQINSVDPSIPLIVFTHLVDVSLWLDALEAGSHDVVPFPFEERDLIHVLGSASRGLQ
jgi:DNA-binding NtrC family response regulator